MNVKFKYHMDSLFLVSLALYAMNKTSALSSSFWDSSFRTCYLNDLVLVPVLVPPVLLVSRMLTHRAKDLPPTLLEIILLLTIWSAAFEFIGPHCFGRGTSDPLDVAAYWLGGFISWAIWNARTAILRFQRQRGALCSTSLTRD